MKKILTITFALLLWAKCFGQDPQFTQFYAKPLYLNPAFAGTTEKARLGSIYRNQWTALPGSFSTFSFSADQNITELNSGVGIMVMSDRQGVSKYKLLDLGLIYSYGLQIHDKWAIHTGLQFNWARRTLDTDDLIFGNQLDADVGFTGASSGEISDQPVRNYFDFSTGILAYNKTTWIGVALHHLNQPNQSFFLDQESLVPFKLTVHGGAKLKLVKGEYTNDKRTYTISPAFNYRYQGKYDQLDLGAYINYDPIVIGLWYRGLPGIKKSYDFVNHDAIAILLGYHFKDFLTIGYSYDLTISKLGTSTGGSHELSVGYEFTYGKPKKKKYEKFIPCPKF